MKNCCDAQDDGEEGIVTNSFFVKKGIKYTTSRQVKLELDDSVPKCASFLKIGKIVIANTHLTGGRTDDYNYENLLTLKIDLMKLILTKKPDIIVGDFNGEKEINNV